MQCHELRTVIGVAWLTFFGVLERTYLVSSRRPDGAGSVRPAQREARNQAALRGAALYEKFDCASCHEAARTPAGGVVVELVDLSTRYSTEDLAQFLQTPTPPMPVFPMTETERRDLAVFMLGVR